MRALKGPLTSRQISALVLSSCRTLSPGFLVLTWSHGPSLQDGGNDSEAGTRCLVATPMPKAKERTLIVIKSVFFFAGCCAYAFLL